MTVLRSMSDVAARSRRRSIVTIGSFDGMHRGHHHLLEQAGRRAHALGVDLLVVTFEPLPAQVLRPEMFSGRICTDMQKQRLLQALTSGPILILPFSREFAATSAEAFVGDLHAAVDIVEIWVGEEFALGKERRGTIATLEAIGQRLGFDVVAVRRVEIDGQVVSSSLVRSLLHTGQVAAGARLLGRPFCVRGPVCEGAKLGRTMGFPTANVLPPDDLVMVADGIYASLATLGDSRTPLPAMTYIGTRPALNPGSRVIETHLFDFDADIYGQDLTTQFIEHLRPDANFPNLDGLVAQMRVDETQARAVLAASSGAAE